MVSQHVILRIVHGRTQLPTRSFTRGEPVPQFSVGSRGDWIVSGVGVASFHVVLMFDGEHVFAAAVDPATAPVYLKGSPIGNTWHAVTPSTELRFGEASLIVTREASLAPPAGASPPRPPKPDHRHDPLPPVTVRQPPKSSRQIGPGNTQFFENPADQKPSPSEAPSRSSTPASAPPAAPAAGGEALMAAVAPTLAKQPTTFPMQPPMAPLPPSVVPWSAGLQSTELPRPSNEPPRPSTEPPRPSSEPPRPSTDAPQSAAPPPLISAPQPWQPEAPPALPIESMPTAFSPQFPGDVPPAHAPKISEPPGGYAPVAPLPSLPGAQMPMPGAQMPGAQMPGAQMPGAQMPGAQMPAANLPTLASDSQFTSQPPTPGWGAPGAMYLPTHFAPAGSIALPPEAAPTAIAPTDDGAPLPLGMPFGVPPLPMPPNAGGEPFSTVAADADAIRNFAAHLPPSPPDPALPPMDGMYASQYMHSHSSLPPPGGAYPPPHMHGDSSPPYDNQTPPPYAPAPRLSRNPRTKQSQGTKWLLIVVLPLLFASLLVALAWFLIAR